MFVITVDYTVVVIAADNPLDALIQFNRDWHQLDDTNRIDIRRVSGTSLAGRMSRCGPIVGPATPETDAESLLVIKGRNG